MVIGDVMFEFKSFTPIGTNNDFLDCNPNLYSIVTQKLNCILKESRRIEVGFNCDKMMRYV
jgi:hypothetical protein